MASSLREDEQFVIEALCASYNGTWSIGEDPPDTYMALVKQGDGSLFDNTPLVL